MKMIVCGSRTWGRMPDVVPAGEMVFYAERVEDQKQILNHVLQTALDVFSPDEIIDGGAKGADYLGARFACSNNIPSTTVEADWARLGKAAGPLRNQKMLEMGPELVVAFVDKPLEQSTGTADMVKRAKEAGVSTWVIEYNDRR